MARSPPLSTLVLVLVAAGCVGAQDPPPRGDAPEDAEWAARALPFGEGHDHKSRDHHANLSTPNFEVVGWNPLISESLKRTPGGHFCGDAQETPGGRRLAAVEQRNIGGFALVDVTDPLEPAWLGELVMRNTRVYDLAVVPDGKHVVLVTTEPRGAPVLPPLPLVGDASPSLAWRACGERGFRTVTGEDLIPRPSSLVLVSIENPNNPRVIDQRPLAVAGHSVMSAVIDGRAWLLVAAHADGRYRYEFHEVAATPAGAKLRLLSVWVADDHDPARPNDALGGHDGWIAKHPGTEKVLAYVSTSYGFAILDLSDPASPRRVGYWSDWTPDRAAYAGQTHSLLPMDSLWDGRHYTLLGPEFGARPGPNPSGTIWMLDTTDPSNPTPVGAWILPVEVEWTGTYMFSNHYFSVHNRTLFASMYHGGVWAVDLDAGTRGPFALLPSVGVFIPDYVSPAPPETNARWAPTVEDVIAFDDGAVVLFDGTSGLYALRFDASRPMRAPAPWPIVPP